MTTDHRAAPWWVWPTLALALAWPAVWNGYPIVFADTGTYLSQAIHRYAGWDRPIFYSLFLLPLHGTVTTWPVVFVQGAITAWVLLLVGRVMAAGSWAPLIALFVTAFTWQPWLVAQLMPDLFTPLVVLSFGVMAWGWNRLMAWERWVIVGLTSFMIATQQSSVALWAGLCAVLVPLGRVLGPLDGTLRRTRMLIPLAAALLGLATVNLAAHGRFSPSPFGDVFLLARLLADGPALRVMRAECPAVGWRLCERIEQISDDSDVFLWAADSPILAVGGHKALAREAGEIVATTLRREPVAVVMTMARNTASQLIRMTSGDGFQPWSTEVTPRLRDDFPAWELDFYRAARQQQGEAPPADCERPI